MPGMEDGLFPGYRAFENMDGMEEERRLCYVGITRAKEKLYMTSAAYRVLIPMNLCNTYVAGVSAGSAAILEDAVNRIRQLIDGKKEE